MRTILIHAEAPPKPAPGAPCNGCGICCLSEPCPLGIWVSGRRQGACEALQWSDEETRYVCGMLANPAGQLGWREHSLASRLLRPLLGRLVRRWIAAGQGCDCELEPAPAPGKPLADAAGEAASMATGPEARADLRQSKGAQS